jgi:DNA-binding MarR family transcriptional regulator
MSHERQASPSKVKRSRADPDPLQMRILWEVTRHPGWDMENLADALGASLSDVARAVDALLRKGMLAERPSA